MALLHEWMTKEMEIVSLRDQPYKASHMTKQETKVGGKAEKAERKTSIRSQIGENTIGVL